MRQATKKHQTKQLSYMKFEKIEEYNISLPTHSHIQNLLKYCFEQYPSTRSYYKQIPHFRYLVWDDDILVAHCGVEHRVIALGKQPIRILGIVDLCVNEEYRSKGIASDILEKVEFLGEKGTVDFIVLFADDHSLYEKNGYQLVNNPCRWLMINEHQSLGVTSRTLPDTVMVKPLSFKAWDESKMVDFMGHVF